MAESREEMIAAAREILDEVLGRELRDLRSSIEDLVKEMRARRRAEEQTDTDVERSKEPDVG